MVHLPYLTGVVSSGYEIEFCIHLETSVSQCFKNCIFRDSYRKSTTPEKALIYKTRKTLGIDLIAANSLILFKASRKFPSLTLWVTTTISAESC